MLSSSLSAKITKFLLFQISFFVFEIIILSQAFGERTGQPGIVPHTYDFYLVRTGKGKSYYGQYGCSDDLTPADTAEINRHRADIGLEPLEAERRDKNVIYITY